MKNESRLHEIPFIHWMIFAMTTTLTSYLIATQPDNPLPLYMMGFLLVGFVKIVGRLTEPR